jgi:hypothetical protein
MFIKLNFTSNRVLGQIFGVLSEIVNNPNITSISSLTSEFTSKNYNSGWLSGLDLENSELWRTADSSKVTAHFSKAVSSSNCHSLVLEFSSYDDDDLKYYTRYYQDGTAESSLFSIGTGINQPMTSTEFSLTNAVTISGGTTISTVTNNPIYDVASGTNGFSNVRTFWCYLTNNGMIWATTNSTTFNIGFGTTYTNRTAYNGPFIVAQYTRFDNHNNVFNQIRPVIYYNFGKPGGLTVTDLTATQNTGFTTNDTTLPFRCINFLEAYNQSTGFPIVFHPLVGITLGGKSNNHNVLSNTRVAGAVGTFNAPTHAGTFRTDISARRPTADAIASGFGLISMGWEELFRGNHGGNVSDRSKFYIFNAEYAPGDEFILDGTTWMIWPIFNGFVNRLGLAIPKE